MMKRAAHARADRRRSPWAWLAAGLLSSNAGLAQVPVQQPDARQRPAESAATGEKPSAPSSDSETGTDKSAPAKLITPRPLDTRVAYPAGATGDATVYLQFVVQRDGRVREIEVLDGEEPFASAAVSSARSWRFKPGQRGEQIIETRIRFRVEYEEVTRSLPPDADEPALDASETAPPVTNEQSAEATVAEHIEIVVEGEREPGSLTLTTAEAREVPGAFGDPIRAIDILPGVSPIVSGLPFFFVRGAPPGNVGFFIDGVRVPMLYHAFLGPAVIHPEMTQRLDLHRGPYPARYGRYAGAVAALETARPRGEWRGSAMLRLYDAGALVEAPFAEGKGAVIVAGRYSFTGLVLSQFLEGSLGYWDYQALPSYDLDRHNTLSAFAFGALDSCQELCTSDEANSDGVGTQFHRLDLRWDHRYSRGHTRLAVTGGIDRSYGEQGFSSRNRLGQVRFEIEHKLTERLRYRGGADVLVDDYDLDFDSGPQTFDDVQELFFGRTDSVFGAHSDLVYTPSRAITVTPGARVDVYESAGDRATGVDARISASFQVLPGWKAFHGFGISHQTPNYVPNFPGIQVAGLGGGLQKAVHSSAGVETELPEDLTLTLSVFNNAYFDLTDPFSITQDFALDAQAARRRLTGTARGLEVFLRRPLTRRLGGMLSYTLSRSSRSHGRIDTLSGYDRSHVLNAAITYQFATRWRAGVRSVFYSGVPGSRVTSEGRIFDQDRGRPFIRFDWRVEYRAPFGANGYWALFAEALNTTATKEVVRRTCGPNGCNDSEVGPIPLGGIGAEIHF